MCDALDRSAIVPCGPGELFYLLTSTWVNVFTSESLSYSLIHQWGSDPGVWLIRCPHRGAHQHRLDVLRILETVSSKLFVITILSLIASMDIYVDHDEARTS